MTAFYDQSDPDPGFHSHILHR